MQKLQNQAELGAPVAPRSSPKIESKQLEIIGGLSGTAFFLFFEVRGGCHDRLIRTLYSMNYVSVSENIQSFKVLTIISREENAISHEGGADIT